MLLPLQGIPSLVLMSLAPPPNVVIYLPDVICDRCLLPFPRLCLLLKLENLRFCNDAVLIRRRSSRPSRRLCRRFSLNTRQTNRWSGVKAAVDSTCVGYLPLADQLDADWVFLVPGSDLIVPSWHPPTFFPPCCDLPQPASCSNPVTPAMPPHPSFHRPPTHTLSPSLTCFPSNRSLRHPSVPPSSCVFVHSLVSPCSFPPLLRRHCTNQCDRSAD